MSVIACVGAVVVDSAEMPTRILLVKRDTDPWKGMWTNPAGKVEGGETLEEAVEREVFEETGIQVRAVRHLCTFDEFVHDPLGRLQAHYVCVNYLASSTGGRLKAGTDIADARWVTLKEARELFENDLIPKVTIRPYSETRLPALTALFAARE